MGRASLRRHALSLLTLAVASVAMLLKRRALVRRLDQRARIADEVRDRAAAAHLAGP
jgi:hypothetical protein